TSQASKTPPPPTSFALAAVDVTSLTKTWNAVGATDRYHVEAAPDAGFSVVFTSAGPAPALATLAPQGLAIDTTYYLRVSAVWTEFRSYGATQASTVTLTNIPMLGAPPFVDLSSGSFTARWSPNGNPLGTRYAVSLSSSDAVALTAGAVLVSTAPEAATEIGFGDLLANATQHVWVAGQNRAGVRTAYVKAASPITLLNAPATAVTTFTAVAAVSADAAWSANGNSAGTRYEARVSPSDTDPNAAFSVGVATEPEGAPAAQFAGLPDNTTAFLHVRAIARDGSSSAFQLLGSTITGAYTPAGIVFPSISSDTIVASATAPGSFSKLGVGVSSVALSIGGTYADWADVEHATFTGLTPNTPYSFRAKARNQAGTETPESVVVTTFSYAAVPSTETPTFTAVWAASVAFQWTHNNNPAGTQYLAQASTAADFSGTLHLSGWTVAVSTRIDGLTANTTYEFRVKARNAYGVETDYRVLGATSTLAFPPALAAQPFPGVDQTSMTVAWLAPGNPLAVTTYTVVLSTEASYPNANDETHVVAATAPAGALEADVGGLSRNTSYYLFVSALNHNGLRTPYVLFGSTWTRVAAPGSAGPATFGPVQLTSAPVSWTAGPNPPSTEFQVSASTSQEFGGLLAESGWTTALSTAVQGLFGDTTYYFRVRARNGNGVPGEFTQLGSTMTLPAEPGALALSGVSPYSITANWSTLNQGGELNGWEASASLPAASQGFGVAVLGGRIYIAGGSSGAGASSAVSFAAVAPDGTLGAWTAARPLPAPRDAPALAAWGGRLYVAGGADGGVQTTVWSAAVAADGSLGPWVAHAPLPAPRTKLTLSAHDGWLYAAGGDNGVFPQSTVYSAQVQADGSLSPWAASAALSVPRSGHGAAVAGGRLYVAGGVSFGLEASVAAGALNAGAVSWSGAGSLPAGRTRHALAASPGRLYAVGGHDGSNASATVWSSTISADGSLGAWVEQPGLPSARFMLGAAAVGERVYAIGGSDGASALSEVRSSSMTGTRYQAERSDVPTFSGPGDLQSPWLRGQSFMFSGLTPNTSYYFRVRAQSSGGSLTPWVPLESTMTWTAPPGTPLSTFTAVEVSSIGIQWTLGSNPEGTEFLAQASTAADFSGTVLQTGWAAQLDALFTGLSVNTSYYFRAQGRNGHRFPGPTLELGASFTLSPAPVSSTITAIQANGFTLEWSTGNLPSWTRYEAQASTTSDFSLVAETSVTTSSMTTFGGLPSAATFYARVRSINGNGVPSAFDLAVSTRTGADATPPAISTGLLSWPAGTPNTVVLSWIAPVDDAGIGGDLPVGSKFFVQWSSKPHATVTWSPANAQLFFSTGPVAAGQRVSTLVGGLPAESTVTLRVWARDEANNTSVQSDTTTVFASPFAWTRLDGASGDAGLSPSLAVDRFGNLHLAYRGASGDLRYLKRTGGTWGAVEAPDPGVVAAEVAVAADAEGEPQIAYRDLGVGRLKVARRSGSWTSSIVDAGDFRLGGFVVDAGGRGHLSYHDAGPADLKYARWTGAAWETETVLTAGPLGRLSALALSLEQRPVIAYTNDSLPAIGLASMTAAGWQLSGLDGAAVQAASTTVLAFNGIGSLLAAFPDPGLQELRISSGFPGQTFVTSVPQAGAVAVVGGLGLDGDGRPFVTFFDAAASSLRYVRYHGVTYTTGTIDADGAVGQNSSVAVDGAGSVFVAYYDGGRGDLKFAEWTAAVTPTAAGNSASRAMAPSGLGGAAFSDTQLQWTFTDNASGELGFALYGSLVSTGPYALVIGSGTLTSSPGTGGARSYVENGLTPNTTYYRYAVVITSGGFATSRVAAAYPFNTVDVTSPTITNNQTGDGIWRRANAAQYDVDFADIGGSKLSKFQVRVATRPAGESPDIVPYTDVVTSINADTYNTDWALPPAVFDALWESATNYVTIRVLDGLGDATELLDAFYVLKDTSAPSLANSVVGDAAFRTAGGTLYDVDALDLTSRVAAFQYSASTRPGSADGGTVPWTDIVSLASPVTSYATDWPVLFAALPSDVTSYVSIRAWDVAGATTTAVDAFYVRKDTAGPTVRITAPVSGTVISSLTVITGTAADWAGIDQVQVSIQHNPPGGNYWNGAAFLSASQQFFAATSTSAWQFSIPNAGLLEGAQYRVVARGTDLVGNLSTSYSTSTVSFDGTPPVSRSTRPVLTVDYQTLGTLAGTAADPSSLSAVEVRLKRASDGFYWNWVTEVWSSVAVSSVATGTAEWTIVPTARLKSFLTHNASYYVQSRASDQVQPANSGDFLAGVSTFTFVDTTPPGSITDLAGSSTTASGRVFLSWTSPGDDGSSGDVLFGQYAVGYSTDSNMSFSTATAQVFVATASVLASSRRGLEVTNLVAGTTYYLHAWLSDDAGNWSPLSNAATMQAGPPLANQIGGRVVKVSSEGITAVLIDCFDAGGALISSTFTVADGLGSFTLGSVPPGTFRVQATWSADGISSSVSQDNIQQGASALEFILNLGYTLSSLTGTLGALNVASTKFGALSRPAFAPADGSAYGAAKVELFAGGRRAVEVPVNPTGRWTIPNLLPGKYGVRAFNGVTYTDIMDVELGEGELKEVGFVYNPLPDATVFAYPNPAKSQATFRFETPLSPLEAQVLVFDLAGQLVREIPGSEMSSPGPGLYHAPWDLRNASGEPVASGVYLFMVKVKGGSDQQTAKVTKKLAVVK
ncbi:MAG: hypothetical protein HY553_11325, partial [Elusimicrobia bacterium]|nr:hypothetical protein [Elusimicrobiota bacterium]